MAEKHPCLIVLCYHEIFKAVGPGIPKVGMEPVFIYVVGNLAHTDGLYERLGDLPLGLIWIQATFHSTTNRPFHLFESMAPRSSTRTAKTA